MAQIVLEDGTSWDVQPAADRAGQRRLIVWGLYGGTKHLIGEIDIGISSEIVNVRPEPTFIHLKDKLLAVAQKWGAH